jgi:HAE1 family hydrophobic/amphiphilic exporter-1
MGLIQFAVQNPVKIAVGVILVVIFGFLSVFMIPIQLVPDVDRPVITVQTFWRGASPQEIETEIIDRQEDKLKSVTSLSKMTSEAKQGSASIRLEFPVSVNKDIAYRDVSDKLRQVTGYPEEVDEPVLSATDNEMEKTIAWMILYGKDGEEVAPLKTFVEEKVKPILERAEGISEVSVYGGIERQMRVEVDAHQLAARGLTFGDLERALRGQNANISAGTLEQGKRDYSYRTIGEFRTVQDVGDTVIAYRTGAPVYVRDVARVLDDFYEPVSFVRSKGRNVIAMPARRETGANVIQAIENLKRQIELVNKTVLASRGLGLELTQVYDETTYINSAIRLVVQNILVGGALAIVVLLLFLRSGSATGIISLAIPISVIGTFLIITMLGRSLNVVMLAGMAFAVGMVVDNAIVVLENIFRHRSMGKTKLQAALDGTREVWGAILASTLTTMAVFIPVIFIEEEAGQLFRDIAIAIASAVGLSLLVSVLVIPPLASRFFSAARSLTEAGARPWWFATAMAGMVERINRTTAARVGVVVGMTGFSVVLSWLLLPSADYLPVGNKNLVFGLLFTPPGYSIEEFRRSALLVEEGDPNDPTDGLRPFWEADAETADRLPPVSIRLGLEGKDEQTVQPPPIDNFFFVSFDGGAFMGCTSREPTNVKPLEYVMNRAGSRIPGVFTFFRQTSLFSSGRNTGNTVDVEVRGDDIEQVTSAAGAILGRLREIGYGYIQPSPTNFDLGRPEIQLIPKRTQAADLGFNVRDVGFVAEACVEGAFVGEFNDHGDKIDLIIKVAGTKGASLQQLGGVPVYTPSGKTVPLSSVVNVVQTTAPQQINHIEEMNAVTLSVAPKPGVALQETMRDIDEEVIAPLRKGAAIPEGIIVALAGTADKLTQTQRALLGNFTDTVHQPRLAGFPVWASMLILFLALAIVSALLAVLTFPRTGMITLLAGGALLIVGFFVANPLLVLGIFQSRMVLALIVTYLLMAALFESFLYPFVIMFTVPLAAVGGIAALQIVHLVSLYDITAPIQELDVLTMLGFVLLVGIVVNNAILLIHQALTYMREEGLDPGPAVVRSVQTRTRPIFMSAFTSVFGMFPLVVMPGAGSELYRGLGSVVVGGLIVSTMFTLVLIPALFSLVLQVQAWLQRVLANGRVPADVTPAPAAVHITEGPGGS